MTFRYDCIFENEERLDEEKNNMAIIYFICLTTRPLTKKNVKKEL